MIDLPSVPTHEALPQNQPFEEFHSLVNQGFESLDAVLQQMSQNQHSPSDLRQSSSYDASNHARNDDSKATLTVPVSQGTSQLNCSAEQTHTTDTARENAIASLIVLANIVPVYYNSRFLTPDRC